VHYRPIDFVTFNLFYEDICKSYTFSAIHKDNAAKCTIIKKRIMPVNFNVPYTLVFIEYIDLRGPIL
jgi:hypothetical protein